MKRTLVAVAVTTALFSGGAFAQAAAPAPKAAPKAAAAPAEKQLYSQAQYDVLLKERLAQGGQHRAVGSGVGSNEREVAEAGERYRERVAGRRGRCGEPPHVIGRIPAREVQRDR